MKLIYATLDGLPHEFLEEEAVDLYLALREGLSEAGIDADQLSAKHSRPVAKATMATPPGVAFFGRLPTDHLPTDC